MPGGNFAIQDGTVCEINLAPGGAVQREFIGFVKSGQLTITQDMQDSTGPRDGAKYGRPNHVSGTWSTTQFVQGGGLACGAPVAPTDATTDASSLHLVLPAAGWAEGDAIPGDTLYEAELDLVDGGTVIMTGYITSIGESMGDSPNEESIEMESCGMPTYATPIAV